jgi:hypothetical protein
MVAPATEIRHKKSPTAWHDAFGAMLPAIRKQASYAFRHMRPQAKKDAVAEVVCAVCTAFAWLVAQGKAHVACPSALTRFAVKQYRCGRRAGCRWNVKDVASDHGQFWKRVIVKHLDQQGRETLSWTGACSASAARDRQQRRPPGLWSRYYRNDAAIWTVNANARARSKAM